jgi:hypothetical protein
MILERTQVSAGVGALVAISGMGIIMFAPRPV